MPANYEAIEKDQNSVRNGNDIPEISIIIPAYNAMPYLTKALESVVAQTYDHDRMECIVIDDGSSDTTGEEIQRFVNLYPDLFQGYWLPRPSGSPAAPRNTGIELAHGRYIFFLDADDWLGPEAVERMITHADAWNSDMLLVKIVGEGGRDVPQSMFTGNQPKVDIYNSKVMWSFGPIKLFRRKLIENNNLRFPAFMPEDISFVLRAYVFAQTVSVASDYDYYHCVLYDEDSQCSFSTWNDFESNIEAMTDVLEFVDAHAPERGRNKALLRRLFRRDIANMFLSIGLVQDERTGQEQQKRLKTLATPFYNYPMAKTMPIWQRLVLEIGFHGSWEALREVSTRGVDAWNKCTYKKTILGQVTCILPSEYGGFTYNISRAIDLKERISAGVVSF